MLDTVENVSTKGKEYVCNNCSGVDLFIVSPEQALWKLNGKLVSYETIRSILQQKQITEDESRTTQF